MTKDYYIEVKFGNKWRLVKTEKNHKVALQYVADNTAKTGRYPMRVVRVVRTVVFDGTKS